MKFERSLKKSIGAFWGKKEEGGWDHPLQLSSPYEMTQMNPARKAPAAITGTPVWGRTKAISVPINHIWLAARSSRTLTELRGRTESSARPRPIWA